MLESGVDMHSILEDYTMCTKYSSTSLTNCKHDAKHDLCYKLSLWTKYDNLSNGYSHTCGMTQEYGTLDCLKKPSNSKYVS